jgi:hypothetical protein
MDAIYRTVTSLLMGLMSAIGIQTPPATWQMHVMLDGRTVALIISDHPHSNHSATVPVDQFEGLKPILQANGPAKFRLKRDAGVFEFDGVLRGGAGGGTMEFVPSETFPIELAKRGFAKPSRVELYKMAWHDTGFAVIDELAAQKYQRPSLEQLVSAGDHGIDRGYVRDMAGVGYRLGTVDALIRQHDHGSGPEFVREIAAAGLKNLSADDLVRARDHGVSSEYIREMRSLGYTLSLDDLVRARDHGISPAWVSSVRSRNSVRLSLDQLVSLRDHGVNTLDELWRRTH